MPEDKDMSADNQPGRGKGFVVASKYGSEAFHEVGEPPKKPETFRELQAAILSGVTSDEKRVECIQAREALWDELTTGANPIIKEKDLVEAIRGTLRNSHWGVSTNPEPEMRVMKLATILEANLQTSNPRYRDNPKYHGAVELALNGVATEIFLQREVESVPADQKDDEIETRSPGRRAREVFYTPNFDMIAEIGKEFEDTRPLVDIQKEIMKESTPSDKKKDLMEKRRLIWEEAKKFGAIDEAQILKEIKATIRRSYPTDVRKNLGNLAGELERRARINPIYAQDPRFLGSIELYVAKFGTRAEFICNFARMSQAERQNPVVEAQRAKINDADFAPRNKDLGWTVTDEIAEEAEFDAREVQKLWKEKQLSVARTALDAIEGTDEPLYSMANVELATSLKRALEAGIFTPEAHREIQARLRLQATLAALNNISGKTEDKIDGYRKVVDDLGRAGDLLEAGDFQVLLWEMENINVADAFDVLESVAVDGRYYNQSTETFHTILAPHERQASRHVRLIGDKLTARERELLNENIVSEVKTAAIVSLETQANAEKAIKLARRIASVTGEESIWNYQAKPVGTPLSGCYYLEKERQNNRETGSDRGPEITVNLIPGFGTSYFRLLKADGTHVFNEDDWRNLAKETNPVARRDLFLKTTGVREGARPSKLNIHRQRNLARADAMLGADEKSFTVFLAADVPAMLKVRDVALKSAWETKDITADFVQDILPAVNRLDPNRDLQLARYLAYGLIHESSKRRANITQFSQRDMNNAEAVLKERYGSEAFLTDEDWDWIIDQFGPSVKINLPWLPEGGRRISLRQFARDVLKNFGERAIRQ